MEKVANESQLKRAYESIKFLRDPKLKLIKIIFRFYDEWDIKFGAEHDNPKPMEIIYVERSTNNVCHFIPYCSSDHGYAPSLIEWIYKGRN